MGALNYCCHISVFLKEGNTGSSLAEVILNLSALRTKYLLTEVKWYWRLYNNKNITAPRLKQGLITLLEYNFYFYFNNLLVDFRYFPSACWYLRMHTCGAAVVSAAMLPTRCCCYLSLDVPAAYPQPAAYAPWRGFQQFCFIWHKNELGMLKQPFT